ncbi:segregation/condensation protein A [Candidatus Woesearchaeota archaeon]|nr:segregation/condensation protein A [Candidatus Woesearchaeota archaeon]
MQQRLFDLLVKENEITWKTIIFDLIKTQQMNPWDIDITLLTGQYVETLRQLKQMDFKISGKVVLAAAILLKIKSARLVGEELEEFDRLLAQGDPHTQQFYDDLEGEMRKASDIGAQERIDLIPRTPQPRQRKVSIYDLVGALEKALEVKKRRLIKSLPDIQVEAPTKSRDITLSIKQVYERILDLHLKTMANMVKFSQLVEDDAGKEVKVHTFVPLLHLHHQRKVDLEQQQYLGDIDIHLLGKKGDIAVVEEALPKGEKQEMKKGKVKKEKKQKTHSSSL